MVNRKSKTALIYKKMSTVVPECTLQSCLYSAVDLTHQGTLTMNYFKLSRLYLEKSNYIHEIQ